MQRPSVFLTFAICVTACQLASAGQFRFQQITTDPTTDISTSKTYTHKVDFGSSAAPATINGVTFQQMTAVQANAGGLPGLSYVQSSPTGAATPESGNFHWNPAAGGVTGSGIRDLLDDFIYNEPFQAPGYQMLTLTGLVPGHTYDTRFYSRTWDGPSEATRTITLTFTSGASDSITIDQDRPANAPINMTPDAAYFLSYQFIAGASTEIIRFDHTNRHTFHFYGMTNELVAVPEPGSFALALIGSLSAFAVWCRRHFAIRQC